jgi:hypothetical protein
MKYKVLCPKCGKYGFLTKRWVESSYYPRYVSYTILHHLPGKVRGSKYRGPPTKDIVNFPPIEEELDRESLYRVTYGRYTNFYVGHYSSEKYYQQMQDYKMNKRKSRPNGRRWCSLGSKTLLYKRENEDYYTAYCHLQTKDTLTRIF